MSLRKDDNMPPDPFNMDIPDMSPLANNCRAMYTSFIAAGFKEAEALEITIRVTCAMFLKSM